MEKLPKVLVIAAALCLLVAILIKLTTFGAVIPGRIPINWAKLADTVLLFSIALSLLTKK